MLILTGSSTILSVNFSNKNGRRREKKRKEPPPARLNVHCMKVRSPPRCTAHTQLETNYVPGNNKIQS